MKKIPIGLKDYRKLKEDNYYIVDKSLMIKEYIDRGSEVTLITRPRRFGKTINMSMLAEFFDITKDSREIFKDAAIMQTEIAEEINSYPTIFLTFADAKGSKENIIYQIKCQLMTAYDTYAHVYEHLKTFEKVKLERISKGLMEEKNDSLLKLTNAISFLMLKCHQYYQKKVMLFIDEYDTPFIEAHTLGFYEELSNDLASMLHTSLKTSNDLQFAMLTGIQRVAKENIFLDLNNLLVCTVKDKEYAQYFGFTKEEVENLLNVYGVEYSEDVQQMYDGYNMGGIDIYNPWSIINYVNRKELIPYWVNTSSNNMIKTAMQDCESSFKEGYEELIRTGTVTTLVNFESSFYEIKETSSLWGLFVNAGYLTLKETLDAMMGRYVLRIPNKEIKSEFHSLTAHYLHMDENKIENLVNRLIQQDWNGFLDYYQDLLLNVVSYFDLMNENSYQTLLLGILMRLENKYEITSNRERGEGRFDICLDSKCKKAPSILIELKYTRDENIDLERLAQQACEQITTKRYTYNMQNVIKIGLAHRGKQVKLYVQKD
ncbi:ATP-binding protein [[Clostridium] innocuum]|nr:ATP-binding protein [[Clostridium] innocuum]